MDLIDRYVDLVGPGLLFFSASSSGGGGGDFAKKKSWIKYNSCSPKTRHVGDIQVSGRKLNKKLGKVPMVRGVHNVLNRKRRILVPAQNPHTY